MDRILIAVPTYGQNDSRFTTTAFLLAKLPGTDLCMVRRSMPDKARNALIETAFKLGHDFIFFLDDDMVIENTQPAKFLAGLVRTLIGNPVIDVLAPLAFKRTAPFHPCVFTRNEKGLYDPIELNPDGVQGIMEVDAIHFAATLVRTSLFRKLPKPWFHFSVVNGIEFGEDISLSMKITAAESKICCDTSLEVGHISDPMIVDQSVYENFKTRAETRKIVTPDKRLIIPP